MTGKKLIAQIFVVAAALAAGGAGTYYWMTKAGKPTSAGTEQAAQVEETKQYTCSMHPFIVTDKPGACPICGMTLVPVKAAGAAAGPGGDGKKERRILFYRNPMNPQVTSPVPAKDEMGMEYVPVYEDEGGEEGTIRVDPNTVQSMGVRTAPAEVGELRKTLRTVGRVAYDERRIATVNSKVNGWIERLYVNTTGEEVKKGAPLIDIYSPDLVSAQQEYLIALRHFERVKDSPFPDVVRSAGEMLDSAKKRLGYWDITEAQIEEVARTGEVRKTLTLHSPFHGVVVSKAAFDGTKVMAGMELFRIADLSRVWVQADIYEYELPWVKAGAPATVTLDYFPGRTFRGKVSYVYPYLEGETRTATARVELANPGGVLKPDMFAHVALDLQVRGRTVLIPSEAVIRSGLRNVVFVSRGGGRFEPREVTLGLEGEEGKVQVLSGIEAGENVVVSAQFLLDSESSLREALRKFRDASPAEEHAGHDAAPPGPPPAAPSGRDAGSMEGMDDPSPSEGMDHSSGGGH